MQWIHFVFLISLTAGYDDQLENSSLIDMLIQSLDKNGDGKLTEEDLKIYGGFDGDLEDQGWGLGDVPFEAIIRKLDKNNDNAVDHADLEIEVKRLSDAVVGMFDFDNNGYATKNELYYVNDVFGATTVKGLELYLTFLFDLMDLTGDGIISDSDFPKLAPFQKLKSFLTRDKSFISSKIVLPLLKTIDVNEDYQISKIEIDQLLTKIAEKVDMNNDGTVTLQEILQSMVWFDLLDVNGDEFISDDDYPELAPFQTLKTLIMMNEDSMLSNLASVLIKAIDTNGDDELSKTEMTHFLTETMDKLDQNDDGTVKSKEVLKTMEEFKFPEKLVQRAEYILDPSNKRMSLLFNNFDTDADDKINGDEWSNAFTKPMSSSFTKEIQESYTTPPYTYPYFERGTYAQNMNATLASVSSFLRSPSSAASVKISFSLTCFVFVCSYLIN